MSGKNYLHLTNEYRIKTNSGQFGFKCQFPRSADIDTFRLHWYGGAVWGALGDLDIQKVGKPQRRLQPSLIEFFGTLPVNVELKSFQPWLEYRLEQESKHKIQEEEDYYTELRDWLMRVQPTLLETGWDAFLPLAHQGIQALLEARYWWVIDPKNSNNLISPHSRDELAQFLDWKPSTQLKRKKQEEQPEDLYGLDVDLNRFQPDGFWIARQRIFLPEFTTDRKPANLPPIEGKAPYHFYFVGALPRPASWGFRLFDRYVQDASRMVNSSVELETGNESLKTDDQREKADHLQQVIYKVRDEIASGTWLFVDERAWSIPESFNLVMANHPLVITVLLQQEDGQYAYHFDWDQKGIVQDLIRDEPNLGTFHEVTRSVLPKFYIEHALAGELGSYWSLVGDTELDENFKLLFFDEKDQADSLMLIPIPGHSLGESESIQGFPMLVQIAWPQGFIPLLPEIRAALHRAVLDQAPRLRDGLLMHQYNLEYGRFTFVKSLSHFFSHNLPKTIVAPLLTLSRKIERIDDPAQKASLAARVRSFANLLDSHLKSLDVFRLPGSRKLETAIIDFNSVLDEIRLVFEALVDERAFRLDSFHAVRNDVSIEIENDIPEYVEVRGYPPAVFHSLFVPIDNAVRRLDAEKIAQNPKGGRIHVRCSTNHQQVLVSIKDRTGGFDVEKLPAIKTLLSEVKTSAIEGRGLSIERHSYDRRGARLGLGLPLATYFLALLHDEAGQRGGLKINNQVDKGAKIELSFPINPKQTEIEL